MTYLLDTCILSKLRKINKHPDKPLENWIGLHQENAFFLSVLTVGEIEQGIHKLDNSQYRRLLENWCYSEVVPRFMDRILSIDIRVALTWGELNGKYQKRGIVIPTVDGLIAATAIVNDLIVVTENIKDFAMIDELKLFSPWENSVPQSF